MSRAAQQAAQTPSAVKRPLEGWLAYIEAQHPQSIALGLDRVRSVAARMELGRPGRHVITVGGTNGKGSTVAFIEAIAGVAGWRVGAYTSPHLLAYNERVRIDGREATDAQLVAAFEAVEAARIAAATGVEGDVPLTYFEFGTLAALWLFARSDLYLAVLEVGLGGRLDAVNVIDADVAVITTVDLDHQDWLGEDREAIGFEKAGIARSGRPLILGDDDPPASVLRHAYAIGAPAYRLGCDFFIEHPGDAGSAWTWRDAGRAMELPQPALTGAQQLRNAACAIAALRATNAGIPEQAFARGLAQARLPGRLQRFVRDDIEIVLDVAHNPQAARALADWLRAHPAAGRCLAVFGALADKDIEGMVAPLQDVVDTWLPALLDGPRAPDLQAFAGRLRPTAAAGAAIHPDVGTALTIALRSAGPGDRLLVFGSFRTVAAALDVLGLETAGAYNS
ncbi:MAG TPA: bifunctional tetrahydrofolate synthase/dihydrofolate synthase [Xanthomonadaceae bacterium]|nr:bifunctional tetrahydrofolate synthase/dihydrofolate synthase [Xanthomonadaceae bacterium]